MEITASDTSDSDRFSTARVARLAWVLVIAGAAGELILRKSFVGAISLTVAGAVAIINFRWLELVLERVLQPGRPQFDGASVLRILARMGLLAGVMAALLWVPKIDPIAIAIGFTTLVVALVVEGLRAGGIGGG